MYSRSIGTVKWFGGWNNNTERENDFGFIEANGKDIFVHRKALLPGQSTIDEQEVVCFVSNYDQKKGKYFATEVCDIAREVQRILETEETVQSVLTELLASCDEKTVRRVIPLIPMYMEEILFDERYCTFLSKVQRIEIARRVLNQGLSSHNNAMGIARKLILTESISENEMPLDDQYGLLLGYWNLEHSSEFAVGIARLIARFPEVIERLSTTEIIEFLAVWPNELLRHIVPHVSTNLYGVLLHERYRGFLTPVQKNSVVQLVLDNECNSDGQLISVVEQMVWNEPLDSIWLQPATRLRVLLRFWNKKRSEALIREIANIIKLTPYSFKELPEILQSNEIIFGALPPIDQANHLWEYRNSKLLEAWSQLSRMTKLLCVYRAVHENVSLGIDIATETDRAVKYGLGILWSRDKAPETRTKSFLRLHELLQEYVISVAWKLHADLDFSPLIPSCTVGKVRYCEGKKWKIKLPEEESEGVAEVFETVYCPRLRGECSHLSTQDFISEDKLSTINGSRIHAIDQLPWQYWSLLELMNACEVRPMQVLGLNDPDEYISRLAGWINRLIEIRDRLKCSKCEEFMLPNMEYSKRLAAYMTTIVSCKHGDGHDTNIYLNHCWGCDGQIIDSRESKIQVGKYYLCIRCGSGPQEKSVKYRQGDVCPNCGLILLNDDVEPGRNIKCSECNHRFMIPPNHKISGAGHDTSTRLGYLSAVSGLHLSNANTMNSRN